METVITLDPARAAALFQRMGARSADVLVNVARASIQTLAGLAIREGFENQGPTFLNRDTGNAIRTIPNTMLVKPGKEAVEASYGSNLGYIRAHEEGFSGVVRVKEHVRRSARGAQFVRAHDRRVNLRARRMFADSFARHQDVPNRYLSAGVDHSVRTQQVPSPGEVIRLAGG